jgi:hypothetical protein
MSPFRLSRLGLIHACVIDLRNNGIDLSGADTRRIRQVVHQHLDYFQMMLGGEPGVREVVALIERDTRCGVPRDPGHFGRRGIGPEPSAN